MTLEEKKYLQPSSLEEAISMARAQASGFRYLAGGTDLLVNKFQGNESTDCLIDLSGVPELNHVTQHDDFLIIGSLVKLDELKTFPLIQKYFPSLILAAHSAASPILRKTATLGGNILCENRCMFYNQSEWWREAVGYCLKCEGEICIATGGTKACFSKFVSDTAPVLIALEAQLEMADLDGWITIPMESIYTGDGLKPRNISSTAIIKSIQLPFEEGTRCAFRKLRPREAVDFSSLTTAVSINQHGKIIIVLGGVDPKPVVIKVNADEKREEVIRRAAKKPRLVDNDYYSRIYRKEMISVFLNECFDELKIN